MVQSGSAEVVREDAQPAVGEAKVSEMVIESPIAYECGRGFAEAVASLDSVDLKSIFNDRAHMMDQSHSS